MSLPSCLSSSADNFLSIRLPAQVDEARQHAVLGDAAAEVGVLLLAQPGGVGLEEGGVAEDDVPGRVVDGRGEVHVQLVHRRLRLAQEGEGRAQPVVQGRREIHAHLGGGNNEKCTGSCKKKIPRSNSVWQTDQPMHSQFAKTENLHSLHSLNLAHFFCSTL